MVVEVNCVRYLIIIRVKKSKESCSFKAAIANMSVCDVGDDMFFPTFNMDDKFIYCSGQGQ